MKLLYRYYMWRARKAKTATGQDHFKRKAYRYSQTFRKGEFVGIDLTFHSDPQATKEELTADIGLTIDEEAKKFGDGLWPHKPGKYLDGPWKEPYWSEAEGKFIDPNDWKETPQWWADVPEANQQHQPTYRTPRARSTFTRFDPETGKRTYWKYNYKTGKQEQVK